jgi:hypothetical protein
MSKLTFDRLVSATFAVCALAVTGIVISREFRRPAGLSQTAVASEPVYLIGWEDEIAKGLRVGPDDAEVKIMELVDFECPYCRAHAARMDTLRAEFRDELQVIVHHFPLARHRFAQLLAVTIECAALQDAVAPLYTLLFAKQDSIGLKSWRSLADEAGIGNPAEFERCRTANASFPRIEYGRALAERVGATGTPTILINGWMLPRTPSLAELRSGVRAVLAGLTPAEGDSVRLAPPDALKP